MIICGLKLTHDGAVAVLHDDKLVFSIEVEKLRNNKRYSQIDDLAIIPALLGEYGYQLSDVDQWVIDGWDGLETGKAELANHGVPVEITTAPYRETETVSNLLKPGYLGEFAIGEQTFPYTSYLHATGHLASAYCSSEFARRGEPSFVLVWDGGMFPRLYWVDPESGVRNGGELFPLTGHVYATAAHHFGPMRRTDESKTVDDLSAAGKLMAYIALGSPKPELLEIIGEVFHRHFEAATPEVAEYRKLVGGFGSNAEPSVLFLHNFFRDVRVGADAIGASDEDVLTSVHTFLENLLIERVTEKAQEMMGDGPWNLCFVGGCALNIKWNSALRAQPIFRGVWVPPFPNDSGSAIGAAAAALVSQHGLGPITWHARSGPALVPSESIPAGWTTEPCTPAQLAEILFDTGRPVVVLNARAELGPRALGGRSIIAPATDPAMKDELNRIKRRESYRPVAPICLTEFAPQVFDPGTPDPYMLFDHKVRPDWVDKVPAILHLDGTARLQTVSTSDDPTLETILREYHRRSGIPVLCNTSANLNGSGFFPDVASALEWGQIDLVWCEGTLYRKAD